LNFFHVAAPVCGKQPTLDIAMKAAMRPVDNTRDMSVLDRSARTTVKKKTLPLSFARTYRGMSNYLVQKWWARREERLCPPYESAELFQHLWHALMPVICPTCQILVFRRDDERRRFKKIHCPTG
jgi:hypothetical protein